MTASRNLLVLLLGVLPVAFWPGSTSFEALKLLGLALLVAVWLAEIGFGLVRGRTPPLPPLQVLWLGGALAVVIGLSATSAHSLHLVVRSSALALAGAAAVHTAMAAAPADRARLRAAAQVGGALSGLYALTQWFGWLPGVPLGQDMARGIGGLGNPNYVSGLAAILFWPAVGLAVGAADRKRRLAGITLALLHAAVMAVSGAAGPILATLAAGLLLTPAVFARSRRRVAPLVTVAVVGALVGGGILGAAATWQGAALAAGPLGRGNNGELRVINWQTAWAMFSNRPLTGVGIGNHATAWPEVRAGLANIGLRQHAPIATRAHNEPLQWLAETGIAGGVWLVGAAVLVGLAHGRRSRQRPPGASRLQELADTGAVVTAVVHGAVSFPFHLPAGGLVVAVFCGLGWRATAKDGSSAPWHRPMGALLLVAAAAALAGGCRGFVADLDHARGRRLLAEGHPGAAVDALERSVALTMWPGRAPLTLGLAHRRGGDDAAAVRALELSLHHAPSYEAMALLAELDLEGGRHEPAGNRLDKLERCGPPWAVVLQVRYLRGLSALRRSRDQEAATRWTAVLADAPGHVQARLGLGFVAVRAGRTEEARRHYRQAVEAAEAQVADPQPGTDPAAAREMLAVARRALASVR